ncbi:MAG: NTP transferase domain-containing protein [Kineosporiaceae bacterium]
MTGGPAPHTSTLAVVLAGGASRRFGRDKLREVVDGVSLLERALAAVPAGVTAVVAGPERDGGPAAAVLSVLREAPDGLVRVLVLAGDQPFAAAVVPHLLAALPGPGQGAAAGREAEDPTIAGGPQGAIAVDPSGHRQPLLAVYAAGPLRRALEALPDDARGAGLLRVVAGLRLVEVAVGHEHASDVDTPADLARARARARARALGGGA